MRQIMNYYERPTPLQDQANAEVMQHFAEHLKQFKASCDALQNIERNLSMAASDASRAAAFGFERIFAFNDLKLTVYTLKTCNRSDYCSGALGSILLFYTICTFYSQ